MELNKWADIRLLSEFLFPFKLAGGDTESFTSLAMWNSLSVFWKIGEDDLLSVMMKAQGCWIHSSACVWTALRMGGVQNVCFVEWSMEQLGVSVEP